MIFKLKTKNEHNYSFSFQSSGYNTTGRPDCFRRSIRIAKSMKYADA